MSSEQSFHFLAKDAPKLVFELTRAYEIGIEAGTEAILGKTNVIDPYNEKFPLHRLAFRQGVMTSLLSAPMEDEEAFGLDSDNFTITQC